MPKTEFAYYLISGEGWKAVHYTALRNDEDRAILRAVDLRDEEEGKKKLGVRNHAETPHFYVKGVERTLVDRRHPESSDHDNKIVELLEVLSADDQKFRFGSYEWHREKGKKPTLEKIITFKDYQWQRETDIGMVHSKYLRVDLMGRYSASLDIMDSNPFIVIEVVDTHFPSLETFDTFLRMSKESPFLIFFYYLSKGPYFNQVIKPKRRNGYYTFRFSHFISDASFWLNNYRFEDAPRNTVKPVNKQDYYLAIKEKLEGSKFIRHTAA